MHESPLVSAENLSVEFALRSGGLLKRFRAVNRVDIDIGHGEIVALVGESGCGKSTLGRTLLRLYKPIEGSVRFDGNDITHLSERKMRALRPHLQMIFQHPAAALNPRLPIWKSVAEPLSTARVPTSQLRARVEEALERVGLSDTFLNRYPHELSGGQLQRIGIARALIGKPRFVVADEPLSSLDLSVQAQVMLLLQELQAQTGVSLLFITHDLAAAEYLSNRVAVMYLGRMMEVGPARKFSRMALHPYSKALIASIPRMDPVAERSRAEAPLAGEIPSPLEPPQGCQFHTRCPLVQERCKREQPPLRGIDDGHKIACWVV